MRVERPLSHFTIGSYLCLVTVAMHLRRLKTQVWFMVWNILKWYCIALDRVHFRIFPKIARYWVRYPKTEIFALCCSSRTGGLRLLWWSFSLHQTIIKNSWSVTLMMVLFLTPIYHQKQLIYDSYDGPFPYSQLSSRTADLWLLWWSFSLLPTIIKNSWSMTLMMVLFLTPNYHQEQLIYDSYDGPFPYSQLSSRTAMTLMMIVFLTPTIIESSWSMTVMVIFFLTPNYHQE